MCVEERVEIVCQNGDYEELCIYIYIYKLYMLFEMNAYHNFLANQQQLFCVR